MRRSMVPVMFLMAFALFMWTQQRTTTPGPAAPAAIHSSGNASASIIAAASTPAPGDLPHEVADTLALIRRGGPFPHRQDGVVFENRERALPAEPRGYYHEYTVETPGAHDRGARRIITGGDPPRVYYYTDDHYRSFRTLEGTR